MKKTLIALLLSAVLLVTGCSTSVSKTAKDKNKSDVFTTTTADTKNAKVKDIKITEPKNLSFSGLDDSELLPYVKESVYNGLVNDLDSKKYFVENVDAAYYSKEYIDELTYNSKSNVYFGYDLADLDKQFKGSRYIFNLADDGTTTVEKLETVYDDSSEKIMKNVVIGSGVILICVTVSAVTAGASAPAISMMFAASAKTGTFFALSSGVISGASAAIVKGYQTQDPKEAIEASALAASEGFKWGAISGCAVGGTKAAMALHGATLNGLTMNEAAAIQKESKYPLDVIKQFKSMDEYKVYKEAGLKAGMIGKKSALIRNIDMKYVSKLPDGTEVTNIERMAKGYAPLYKDATSGVEKAYQLHHINQNPEGTLAILKESEHQGNSAILNLPGKESEIDRAAFSAIKKQFWKDFAAQVR